MTHQDSSESDELRPDLFEPGAAPLPAPEPVVTPAANAQPERPIAPSTPSTRCCSFPHRVENAQLRSRDYSLDLA